MTCMFDYTCAPRELYKLFVLCDSDVAPQPCYQYWPCGMTAGLVAGQGRGEGRGVSGGTKAESQRLLPPPAVCA